jgi:hypothetical protein
LQGGEGSFAALSAEPVRTIAELADVPRLMDVGELAEEGARLNTDGVDSFVDALLHRHGA